jgi:glycine/D-amino acid oxidase-like deaminating enzyme
MSRCTRHARARGSSRSAKKRSADSNVEQKQLVPPRHKCISPPHRKQDTLLPVEKVETLIIGGGQAGLMMSAQLRQRGRPHLIVERHRIAERWRTERWDALHANGPAWHDRFPDLPIAGVDPDGFATRDQMVAYFTAYATHIAAPIRCGVGVTALRRKPDGTGFFAETSAGLIEASHVVAATGPFQRGITPLPTVTLSNWLQVPCWWSAPGPPAARSLTSYRAPAVASICASASMTGRRGAIVAKISASGWAF